MRAEIELHHDIERTARVIQVETLFDFPPEQRLTMSWTADLPVESRDWSIGMIVGPSGAGKTSVARGVFGADAIATPEWPRDRSILDSFPATMSIHDVTKLLLSIGLATVPSWLRPHHTLSTGEQFRASVARMLAERPELAVVDEWTSTVDRQVAKVASAATAKAVRRTGRKLVAVTCHYDVEEWLQPDWVYQPHLEQFAWRSVQPRPVIRVDVRRVDQTAWRVFGRYHYLTGKPVAGACYGGFVDGQCIAFAIVAHVPHASPKAQLIRRARRLVVLPDWQGLGIGMQFEEWLAEYYCAQGFRFRSVTAHPGLIRHYKRSPRWRCDGPGPARRVLQTGSRSRPSLMSHQMDSRSLSLYGFEYVPKRA